MENFQWLFRKQTEPTALLGLLGLAETTSPCLPSQLPVVSPAGAATLNLAAKVSSKKAQTWQRDVEKLLGKGHYLSEYFCSASFFHPFAIFDNANKRTFLL